MSRSFSSNPTTDQKVGGFKSPLLRQLFSESLNAVIFLFAIHSAWHPNLSAMKRTISSLSSAALVITLGLQLPASAATEFTITQLGVYDSQSGATGAEIASYHPATKQVYITNGARNRVDIVSIADPANPRFVGDINVSNYGDNINSVAVGKYVVAIAVHRSPTFAADGTPTLLTGKLVIARPSGSVIGSIDLGGSQPDSVTFTPDGLTALVAIEGEPICAKDNAATTSVNESLDYALAKDPRGAVAVVDLRNPKTAKAKLAGFSKFIAAEAKSLGLVVSLTSKDPVVDFEPEFVSPANNNFAYVSLQEANAIAELDIKRATITKIYSAGTTDLSKTPFDLSDRDSSGGPSTFSNVIGLAMPDALAAFTIGKDNYFVSANEGDDRADWTCFKAVDDKRAKDLKVDPAAFPNWSSESADARLGRAKVNPNIGDSNGDGLYEKIHLLSNRSFSIFKNGTRIYDSGNLLEQLQITALGVANINGEWNTTTGAYVGQARSDDKGPEPEGVTVGMVGTSRIAVVGMERMSALLFVDITNPAVPTVIKWEQMLPLSTIVPGKPGLTWSPEGLVFVSAKDSPTGKPLVLTAYEVSGSLSIHQIEKK